MYKLGAVGLAVILAAWTPASSAAQQTIDWDWNGRVDRGDAIEIKGINGEIVAEAGSGNEVRVTARLRGRDDDDPREIEMVVLEHDKGVTICAVYPSKDEDRPNECQPGGRGRTSIKENYSVSVEFHVSVPAGVNFIGRNINGDVDARGIEADVFANTVNGSVDIYADGLAEASTVNGSITVSMGKADWDGTLDFTTVNGSVTLEMPDELDCDVSLSTVNGQMNIDFPLMVEGRFSPRNIKGTIGAGGRTLVVKTVNGSIQIRRS